MPTLRDTLYARLIFSFVAVAAAAIMAVSAIQSWRVGDALLADSGALLHARAEAEARMVGASLDAQVARLRGMAIGETLHEAAKRHLASYPADDAAAARQIGDEDARWPTLASDDPLIAGVIDTPLADELRAQAQLDGNTAELMLTDRRGALVAASGRTIDYNQGDEEWWRQASAGGLFIGPPAFDLSSSSFSMVIAVAVYDKASGAFVGVLRSTYSTDAITLRLAEDRFGAGTRADLLIGSMLLEPGGSELIQPSAEDLLAIGQARDRSYSLAEYEGLPRLIAVAAIPGEHAGKLGWSVVIYQGRSEALAPVDDARQSTLGTALIVLVVTAAAAFFIAGLISAPIRRITVAAERIAAGDLAQRVGLAAGGEIGRLAHGFDQMAASLQERIAGEQAAQAERVRLQQEMIDAQERRIEELAAPTIPLGHDTLLLPLIGSVDERRAERVLLTLLADVHASRARTVILDLSGVRNLDARVVAALMRATAGVSLIGAQVVLVGIRAELARTIADLGIDLAGTPTYATLEDALDASAASGSPA